LLVFFVRSLELNCFLLSASEKFRVGFLKRSLSPLRPILSRRSLSLCFLAPAALYLVCEIFWLRALKFFYFFDGIFGWPQEVLSLATTSLMSALHQNEHFFFQALNFASVSPTSGFGRLSFTGTVLYSDSAIRWVFQLHELRNQFALVEFPENLQIFSRACDTCVFFKEDWGLFLKHGNS